LFALAGCQSVSPVVPVGKNIYTVSAEMSGNFPSWSDVKQLALNKANEHCAGLVRTMVAGKWTTHGARGWSPLNAELEFQCVEK
jgi:hypothetical protein